MTDDHFQNIYRHHANSYDRLIQREDYQGNILSALQAIRPPVRASTWSIAEPEPVD